MKTLTVLFATILVMYAAGAQEADKRTPLERFRGDGQFSLMMCKINLKMALARSELGQAQDEKSDWSTCIKQGKEAAKVNLSAALKTVKKVKAQEALKTYHVALITAIDGIAPGAQERKLSYEQRQQALEGKLTETWARFDVEQ
jgi:hypothetical protein